MEDSRFELFMGLLGSASKSIQRLKAARMGDFDLSAAHTDCLWCLADAAPEGISQTHLAERLGMDRAQISRVLRDLAQHGYVAAESGYRRPYRLTEAGARVAAQIAQVVREVNRYVSENIPAADIRCFYRTFGVIAERLADAVSLYGVPRAAQGGDAQ